MASLTSQKVGVFDAVRSSPATNRMDTHVKLIFSSLITVSLLVLSLSPALAATRRVSIAYDGNEANDHSVYPHANYSGRYVAFSSFSSNLVSGDTNGIWDVFLRDTESGVTTRVNLAYDGSEAGYTYGGSLFPPSLSISADGRYVAFDSDSTNLVKNDTNGNIDVFVRDTLLGATVRVSVASDGSEANGGSFLPIISGSGRFVLFTSRASNLVAGDTNNASDIFVHDMQTGITERVSVASDGSQADSDSYFYDTERAISKDGRYVVFTSDATNLVASDVNGQTDVFWHDRLTGKTELVSKASDDIQSNDFSFYPSISDDGCRIAFESFASNLVKDDTNDSDDAFLRDRCTGTTARISLDGLGQQTRGAFEPEVSPDGRYGVFSPISSYRFGGDIAVRDLTTQETVRISNASDGQAANSGSGHPTFSGDGKFVLFDSPASNLVAMDTNNKYDVFKARNNRAPLGNIGITWIPGAPADTSNKNRYKFIAMGATDPDGTIVDYLWDFGDGQTAHGPTVVHAYQEASTYLPTLTLVDDDGASTVKQTSVIAR